MISREHARAIALALLAVGAALGLVGCGGDGPSGPGDGPDRTVELSFADLVDEGPDGVEALRTAARWSIASREAADAFGFVESAYAGRLPDGRRLALLEWSGVTAGSYSFVALELGPDSVRIASNVGLTSGDGDTVLTEPGPVAERTEAATPGLRAAFDSVDARPAEPGLGGNPMGTDGTTFFLTFVGTESAQQYMLHGAVFAPFGFAEPVAPAERPDRRRYHHVRRVLAAWASTAGS